MNYFHEFGNTLKNIFYRITKRDFSGNTGLAVKNSMYMFSAQFSAKIFSLIFTVIIARLLMPELFGLYSLALSTILVFVAFSELGINLTLIRYLSKNLGKKQNKKAKSYVLYFGKIKIFLVSITLFLLLIFSRFIADVYYQKPLFLALIAGIFYIVFINLTGLFSSILQASNYFRGIFYQEITFQLARLILVPLAVIYMIKLSLSQETIIFYIIILLSVSYLLSSIYLFTIIRKKSTFLKLDKSKVSKLSPKNKKDANKFLFAMSAIIFSGVFFSLIDRIMLGRFVTAEFIGYYTAAFGPVGALASLAGFASIVLLPIFSRMGGKNLEKAMKKSSKIVLLFSVGIFILTILFSHFAILLLYGSEYLLAVNVLRLLSILIFILPITGIYVAYFMSKNKPWIIAKLIIFSTILNIFLNYLLITSLLSYGYLAAVYGAGIATFLSQGVYLGGLVWMRRRNQYAK